MTAEEWIAELETSSADLVGALRDRSPHFLEYLERRRCAIEALADVVRLGGVEGVGVSLLRLEQALRSGEEAGRLLRQDRQTMGVELQRWRQEREFCQEMQGRGGRVGRVDVRG